MVRPVQLMPRPVFPPYVCAQCGVGGGDSREWFIDIGVDNNMALDLRDQGAIYFCNICALNFITDVNRLNTAWLHEHRPFDGDNYTPPSFAWQENIDLSTIEKELNDGRGPTNVSRSVGSVEPASDESIGRSEPSDGTPTELDDLSEPADSIAPDGESDNGLINF